MENRIEITDSNSMELMVKKHLLSKSKLATIQHGDEGTQFTCVECSAQYDDKEKLELHLFSHYHTYRFLCGVCGTGLKRKEHLDRHMQEHTEYRPHVCPECGKGFKRKEHLNIHSSIHKGNKNLACSLCHKTFYRKDHLQKHLQTHNKHFMEVNINPVSEQELDIKQEPEEYDELHPIITSVTGNAHSESSLEMDDTSESTDQASNNSIGPMIFDSTRPFMCPDCGKSYKRKDHLKIHSWTHKKKEVLCGQCGKAFHTADQMLVHVNLVHLRAHEANNEGVMQLRALLGDQIDIEVLNEAPSLLVPRKKPSPENRPHECPVCHRKFKRKQHLKIHANVHLKQTTAANTVWCSLCNEGFSDNAMFESHSCQWSGQDYAENGEYEQAQFSSSHDTKKENNPIEFVEVVVNETNDLQEEANIPIPRRVFVCKFCSKPFKRKDHYKIHLHIHTGIKSFFCPDCGKGFYRKDHLQKHMIVHAKFKTKPRPKKEIPDLFPIDMLAKKDVKPEITIHAPSNTKLRVPLQIKVPYQMVVSLDNGERRAVTVDPQADA
ncbi:zinc finger protein 624-like isoform X1 [Vanessa atalanta]|uniref:zinc finger protein 624-like isoform X1 n=2 Tax=Vanessa atalanta TaxID=42275 RepID=UPI001FCE0444|nr:zinc finger protein 624-like isoform X1 [Vanessa atalanta]